MAGVNFTTQTSPQGHKAFNGGLNSTAGSLELQDNESGDLLNIDFDKFGSIVKRAGFLQVATSCLTGSTASDGLHWYEYYSSGTAYRKLINVSGGSIFDYSTLDGTLATVGTGAVALTATNHCSFVNFMNKMFVTNGVDAPFYWAGAGTAHLMVLPTNVTSPKFIEQFNNYLFYGNVTVSSVKAPSRIYWSNIKDPDTWDADQFIDISKDDGQEITGMKVLQDRLVVYKQRSIYNVFFTGDADFPFNLPGGGKSASPVGCIAPYSIQEVENGHVFMAMDGLYYYDGMNSYKLSYKVQKTLEDDLAPTEFDTAVSCVYKPKNKYMLALTTNGNTNHDRVLIWDYFNNAFSIYQGVNASAMTTCYISGNSEQPVFADYGGAVYKLETGVDDYPFSTTTSTNVQTAIDAYYWTNWKSYDDLCDQKGIPNIYVYYQSANSILSLSYSYDFESGEQYTQTFSLSGGTNVYDTAIWDTATYAGAGGDVKRRDLTGRGRVVRFKFANSTKLETMQIDGLGTFAHLETNV